MTKPLVAMLVLAVGCGRSDMASGDGDAWASAFRAWDQRIHLVVTNDSRSEDLVDFPVLVHLDPSRVDYSAARLAGDDLRFVDAGGALLSHEIERWQPGGDSYVWVRIPSLAARANRDIWLYYGNAAAESLAEPAAVWRNGYLGVYHFADASSSLPSTTAVNTAVTFGGSRVGPHASFNGIDAYLSVPAGWSDFAGGVTIEAWVRPARPTVYARVIDFGNGEAIDNIVFYRESLTDVLTYEVHDPNFRVLEPGVIVDGTWQHLAVTHPPDGVVGLYKNGVLVNTTTGVPLPSGVTRTLNFVGRSNWVTDELFAGDMDELRISNVPRSAEWIDAEYASMTEQMVLYDQRERR